MMMIIIMIIMLLLLVHWGPILIHNSICITEICRIHKEDWSKDKTGDNPKDCTHGDSKIVEESYLSLRTQV